MKDYVSSKDRISNKIESSNKIIKTHSFWCIFCIFIFVCYMISELNTAGLYYAQ